jgi:type III pantothenate kinase
MPLLAVDIGNSDIVFGLYQDGKWHTPWRHPTAQYTQVNHMLAQTLEQLPLSPRDIGQVVVSSVVPGVTPTLHAVLTAATGSPPLMVDAQLYARLAIAIDNPEEIGADLVANAQAAHARFPNEASIVVDFGTALTFTTVSAQGEILGVAIAPGLNTALKALFSNTAQLPMVPLELPTSVIGKNTAHALQAGILLGYVGLVRELLARTRAEVGETCRVLATGGLAHALKPLHPEFDVIDQMLTLNGLRLLGERYGLRGAK